MSDDLVADLRGLNRCVRCSCGVCASGYENHEHICSGDKGCVAPLEPKLRKAIIIAGRAAARIEALAAKLATIERASAHEWFCGTLGECGFVGIRDYAAMQSRAEKAEAENARLRGQPDDSHPTRNVGLLYQQARAEKAERALAEAVEERDLLQWLAGQTHLQLSFSGWDEAEVWEVHSVTGGRNDREWHLIASDTTPTEALRSARAFVQKHADQPQS